MLFKSGFGYQNNSITRIYPGSLNQICPVLSIGDKYYGSLTPDNPYNLASIKRSEISLSYSKYLDKFHSRLVVLSLADMLGTKMALSVIDNSIESIEKRNNINQFLGSYDDNIYKIRVSVGKSFFDDSLFSGITLYTNKHQIESYKSRFYNFGIFGKYRFSPDLNGAFSVDNILSQKKKFINNYEKMNLKLNFGLGYKFNQKFGVFLRIVKVLGDSMRINSGIRYVINNMVSVFTGVDNNSFGVGLIFKHKDISIIYGNKQNFTFGNNHHASVRFEFGEVKNKYNFKEDLIKVNNAINEKRYTEAYTLLEVMLKRYKNNKVVLNMKKWLDKKLDEEMKVDDKINEYLKQAEKHIQNKEYDLAREKYVYVMIIDPKNKEGLNGLRRVTQLESAQKITADMVKTIVDKDTKVVIIAKNTEAEKKKIEVSNETVTKKIVEQELAEPEEKEIKTTKTEPGITETIKKKIIEIHKQDEVLKKEYGITEFKVNGITIINTKVISSYVERE